MSDFEKGKVMIDGFHYLWKEWCFEPFHQGVMEGVYRRATFIKGGLLGETGRYYIDDLILWSFGNLTAKQFIARQIAKKDVQNQRFILLSDQLPNRYEKRSFRLGFCGYAELLVMRRDGSTELKPKTMNDLIFMVQKVFQSTSAN